MANVTRDQRKQFRRDIEHLIRKTQDQAIELEVLRQEQDMHLSKIEELEQDNHELFDSRGETWGIAKALQILTLRVRDMENPLTAAGPNGRDEALSFLANRVGELQGRIEALEKGVAEAEDREAMKEKYDGERAREQRL